MLVQIVNAFNGTVKFEGGRVYVEVDCEGQWSEAVVHKTLQVLRRLGHLAISERGVALTQKAVRWYGSQLDEAEGRDAEEFA